MVSWTGTSRCRWKNRSPLLPHPLEPVPVQPALDTVSLGDPDDLPGDVNAWRATWAGEKFKFRVPARIQETRRQIVQALGLKTEETDKVPESTNRPAQTRSLFADVPEFVAKPFVVVPMDPITVSIASRDAKDILGGSTTALGASTFAKKFPMTARDERECLTPQKIDPDAIAYIKSWINPDFNPQKPFGNAQPHLAAADKLCKRVEERTTSLARLSAFQVQVQAFLHHAFLEQEEIHRALRDDPLGNLPPPSGDFPPEAVRDAMECSAFLTASINRIALHMQAEVRLDNRARLLQSVVPASGRPGFPVYNRKDLLALPLNSDLVFAGKFSETVKATTDTQEVAFQAQRLSQGLLPAQVASTSGYRIPKKSQGRNRSSSGQAKTPTTSDHGAGRRDPPPQGHPPKKESSYSRRGGRGGEVLVVPRRGGAAGAGEGHLRNEIPKPVGGRLQAFGPEWERLTSDVWVLQTIKTGYRIEFTGPCRLTRSPMWTRIPAKESHRLAMETGLRKMLEKRAVKIVDPLLDGPGFYSSLF